MDQGWVAVIGTAVGSIGATTAAVVAGWAGRRDTALQAAAQKEQWRRQLRRDTYGALLSTGAQARDELGSLFVTLRGPREPEELARAAARLVEIKPIVNAVRLATASVFVEGPPEMLEPARRVEEGLVLFHTAMTAVATGPAGPAGADDGRTAAYLATCGQQRVGVRAALMDFASAARAVLDGDAAPLPAAAAPAAVHDSAEELSWLLAGMAEGLAEHPSRINPDMTLWENGVDSLTVLRLAHHLHREHGLDIGAGWFFDFRDQTLRQVAGHVAALRAAGG